MGAGGRRWCGACKHCFHYFIAVYQLLVYPIWLVNFDSLCQHLNPSLDFERVEWYKHGERVNPFHTAHFGILTFDILARETVFLEVGRVVGGLRYLKRCLQELTFSLPTVFRSLAFSLLARSFRSPERTDWEPGTDFYGYAPWQPDRTLPMPRDWHTVSWYCCSFTQSCHWLNSFQWQLCPLRFNAFLWVLLFLFQKLVFADDLKIVVKSSGCESPRHCVFTMISAYKILS